MPHPAITFASLALFLAAAPAAIAQTAPRPLPTVGSMTSGVGGGMSSQPAPFALRDSAGNLVIVNGMLQPAGRTGGLADSPLPVAGGPTATAVANQLTVLATGSWNTIIVDAVQTNTGDITANAGAAGRKADR
jgi:hypothetical protein